MRVNNRVKVISMLMGICLATNVMQVYALGNALTGTADVAHGAQQWSNNCARCHNLRSSTEFSANNWQPIMLHMRIQAGIAGQDARNIYAFLAGQSAQTQGPSTSTQAQNNASATTTTATIGQNIKLATNATTATSSPASSSQSGAAIFQQTCIACHGANGKGAVPGAPDFTSASGPLKQSDAVLLQHIINGFQSPGSPMAMPARGGNPKLTDDDLKQALKYIRSKFGK